MTIKRKLDEYVVIDGVKKPPLIEDFNWKPSEYSITEGKEPESRKMVVEGVLQRADVKNANNRIYSRSLWERVLDDVIVKGKLENRNMYGHLDHPEDGKTRLGKVSHIVTELTMKPDGVIWGKVEILPTREGKDLMELFRAGCTVGISSRGGGTCENRNGIDYVNESDFVLDTWDFVVDPSTPGAEPKVKESKEIKTFKEDGMNKQRLAEHRASLNKMRELDIVNMGAQGLGFVKDQLYSVGIGLAEASQSEDKSVAAEATILLREHEEVRQLLNVSGKSNGTNPGIRESLEEVFGDIGGLTETIGSNALVEGLIKKAKDLKESGEADKAKLAKAITIIEGLRDEYKKLEKAHKGVLESAKAWKGKVISKVTERMDLVKAKISKLSEDLTTANLKVKALEKLKEGKAATAAPAAPATGKPTNEGKQYPQGVPAPRTPTNLAEGKGAPVPANGEPTKPLNEGVAFAKSLAARTGFRH